MYAFLLLVFRFISHSRKLIYLIENIKILVCQIIDPAAAESARPVPTPVA